MTSLAEWKQKIKAEGKFLVGQDTIPLESTRLVVIVDRRKNLDLEELAAGMKRGGVYAKPIPKDDTRPNLYTFVAQAKGLELETEEGPRLTSVTVDTLEDVLGVDAVFVSSWELPATVHPDKITDIRKAMDEVDAQRRANKRLFTGETEVGPNRWLFLRVSFRAGVDPMKTSEVRDVLLGAGYKAFTPDTGLMGFLTPSADWSAGNWTEVLFNPGNKAIKVSDLYGLFPKDLLVDSAPVGLYDIRFLREHQELFDFYFKAQRFEESATGAGGAVGETLTDLLNDFGKLVGVSRYLLWGAVGVGAIWLGSKAYSIVKESYRSARR